MSTFNPALITRPAGKFDIGSFQRLASSGGISDQDGNLLGAFSNGAVTNSLPHTWKPTDIANCRGWYDLAKISTLFQDAARTTPVTGNNDRLGAISDRSGNGNHLTQSNASLRPQYKTNQQNSLPAMVGDYGVAQLVACTLGASIPQPYTVAVVAKWANIDPAIFVMLGAGLKDGIYANNPGANVIGFGAGTYLTSAYSTPAWLVMVGVFNGASSKLRKNGADFITGDIGAGAATQVLIGEPATNDGVQPFGEVVLYSGALSASDISTLESYLNTKWAVY